MRAASPCLLVLATLACAPSPEPDREALDAPDAPDTDPPAPETRDDDPLPPRTFPDTIGGDRPASVVHPEGYDPDAALPAIVLLHGFTVTSAIQDVVFQLRPRVARDGFLLVLPEGLRDANDQPFWNATASCCGVDGPPVDDVAYLTGLIAELRATWRVSTVAVVGHSNGGYMAYRLACDAPASMDRIVVLAGGVPIEAPACADGPPVGTLHVHADTDDVVRYDRAKTPYATAGAVEAVARQAARNGCAGTTTPRGPADLIAVVDGAESTGVAHDDCLAPAALWTVRDGEHVFASATEVFREGVLAFALGGDTDGW